MYVRIARFEGGEGDWDRQVEAVRNDIRSGGEGTAMAGVRDAVKRVLMLADREGGRGAGLVFCETEEDLRRVDEALNQMSPPAGGGTRTSVEMYEVVLDEQPAS